MNMKYRTYKELEDRPAILSQEDIEKAKQEFLSSGGTVQAVDPNDRVFRKQRKAVTTKIVRHK